MLLTIDGGTTNTRVHLVDDQNRILATEKLAIGARVGMENRTALCEGIRAAIARLRRQADVQAILASGMITSEGGLQQVAHLPAPAGKQELHAGLVKAVLPEVSDLPIRFIPGVRLMGDSFAGIDVMRGEETELMGLFSAGLDGKNTVVILPGSHSKLIFTDDRARIVDFTTMLTGEMLFALSQDTILKSAVDFSQTASSGMLLEGCAYAKKVGINQALFKVRILKNFAGGSAQEAYSFFLGAVLQAEVEAVAHAAADKVYLAGKAQIKNAEAELLRAFTDKTVTVLPDDMAESAPALGAKAIWEA